MGCLGRREGTTDVLVVWGGGRGGASLMHGLSGEETEWSGVEQLQEIASASSRKDMRSMAHFQF